MNTNEVAFIVDKIAEKLNVAVDKVQPVAEETIRQYVLREQFYGYCLAGYALIFLFILIGGLISERFLKEDRRGIGYIISIFAFIVMLMFIEVVIGHFANAIAPLPSLFKL